MSKYIFDPIRGELIDPETGEVVEDKIPYEYSAGKPSIHVIEEEQKARIHYYQPYTLTSRFSLGTLRGARLAKILSIRERTLRKKLAELNNLARELNTPEAARRFALKALSKLASHMEMKLKSDVKLRFYMTILALAYMVHGYAFPYKEVYKKYGVRIKPRDVMDLMRLLKVKAHRKTTKQQVLDIISSIKPELTLHVAKILGLLEEKYPRMLSATPKTIAAALLYILGKPIDSRITQQWVSKKIGVTEVAFRRYLRQLMALVTIEVYME